MIDTLLIIVEQTLLYFPLVLGSYISISLLKVPDLSIEAAYVFGAIVAAKTISSLHGCTNIFALLCISLAGIIGGIVPGIISSSLTQCARLPHLLSSILTIGIFHGVSQYVLGTSNMSLSKFKTLLDYYSIGGNLPEIIALAVIFFILAVAVFFLLRTQLGYSFAVYGYNSSFFEHYHIATKFVFVVGMLLASGFAGFGGSLVGQSNGFVDITMGFGMTLFCVTSLILGKMTIGLFIPFSVFIPLVGTIIYFSIQQLLLRIGFDLKYFSMVQAVIVLFVLISLQRKHRRMAGGSTIDHLGV